MTHYPRNIVSKIINLPKLAPSDISAWMNFWDENAKPVPKIKINHNGAATIKWKGLCFMGAENVDRTSAYDFKYVDCSIIFPELYIHAARLEMPIITGFIFESTFQFLPHCDTPIGNVMQFRTMLYDENPIPTFYYMINGKKVYQQFPPNESNTWIFKDYDVQHGSDFIPGYRKLLVSYNVRADPEVIAKFMADNTFDDYKIIE
jgi:hypothetical protein